MTTPTGTPEMTFKEWMNSELKPKGALTCDDAAQIYADYVYQHRIAQVKGVPSDEETTNEYPIPPFSPSHNHSKQIGAHWMRDQLLPLIAASNARIAELEKENAAYNQLKKTFIRSLDNGDQDKKIFVCGRKSWNRKELAEEIRNDLQDGIEKLKSVMMLSVDLLQRNKVIAPPMDANKDSFEINSEWIDKEKQILAEATWPTEDQKQKAKSTHNCDTSLAPFSIGFDTGWDEAVAALRSGNKEKMFTAWDVKAICKRQRELCADAFDNSEFSASIVPFPKGKNAATVMQIIEAAKEPEELKNKGENE